MKDRNATPTKIQKQIRAAQRKPAKKLAKFHAYMEWLQSQGTMTDEQKLEASYRFRWKQENPSSCLRQLDFGGKSLGILPL